MIKILEVINMPRLSNKTIFILLVSAVIIILHNPILNGIGYAVDHIFEFMWWTSGLLDKLIWGVKPQ